jgi:hypothetical protein
MIRRIVTICSLFFIPLFSFCQVINYSELLKGNIKDDNFQIIGKVSGNILIFKNTRSDYSISSYDNEMKLKEIVGLDFLPEKTFNVNYIAYQNFVYLIYQYPKKKLIYCAAIKVDGSGRPVTPAITLDSTINEAHSNKLYTVINSEDKQKIMVAKTLQQNGSLIVTTILLDNNLHPVKKAQQSFSYDADRNVFDNLHLDNDGDAVFNISSRASGREYYDQLDLVTKPALADSFTINNIDLKGRYTGDIFVKIDNINKHYILNTFYYTERKGDVQGIYTNVWDKQNNSSSVHLLISFGDSMRIAIAKEGHEKEAFNNFLIKNMIVKKDGGYILMAEEFSMQQSTPNYNPGFSTFNAFGFSNTPITTYYYKNIMVISIDKTGTPDWNNIIPKDQYNDTDDTGLSFGSFTSGGEIHLFFNELTKREQELANISITADGYINKNNNIIPTKDYAFLPRYGKQVGAKQFVIPCGHGNSICFAKIDY